MSDIDKTTENSKIELTDEQLDGVQGGYTAADGNQKGSIPERTHIIKKGFSDFDGKGGHLSKYQDGDDLLIGGSEKVARKL